MDFYWQWLYDQLEHTPTKEETEVLATALEQIMKVPAGAEPPASSRLLQKWIGNSATQRLLQMKSEGRRKRPLVAEEKTAAVDDELPVRQARPKEVLDPASLPQPIKSYGSSMESRLNVALAAFLITLHQGGGRAEWLALGTAAKGLSPAVKEEAVRRIVNHFQHLDRALQKSLLQRLVRWQQEPDDALASLLWSRLSFSARQRPDQGPGGIDGEGH